MLKSDPKITNERRGGKHVGPDKMTGDERSTFFDFYKTHRSRALLGFLKDIARCLPNRTTLSSYLENRKKINCLIMGCSHWANPRDTAKFLKSFNEDLNTNLAVLDVLPDALLESVKHNADCLPLISPAQNTPFLDNYFDIIICDCLLTCCSFDQHEPVIKEMGRVLKKKGMVLLGIVHSERNITFKMAERPIKNYCRPLKDYKNLFGKYGFVFHLNTAIETRLPGRWSKMRIENCIVHRR